MAVEMLTTYELWHKNKPTIPERSRLHSLKPCGVGTANVESLTSYVARLAATHRVPTGILLGQEVSPLVSHPFSLDGRNLSQLFFSTFFADTGAWNGTGNMASTPIKALSTLTRRHDLKFLTLLTWSSVLPARGLLRCIKAWCPVCYWEWEQLGIEIYEPLLWSLKIVTTCPRHQLLLSCQCPHCGQVLYLLEWQSRPGYCSKCQQWLGISSLSPIHTLRNIGSRRMGVADFCFKKSGSGSSLLHPTYRLHHPEKILLLGLTYVLTLLLMVMLELLLA